ncbi:hypothetical protein BCEP27_70117 [Burkholderia cepacia]
MGLLFREALAARLRGVDLCLDGRAHTLGVLRPGTLPGQFFLLLARTLERGGDDRALLRFGVVRGRCGGWRSRRGRGRLRGAGRAACGRTRFGGFAFAALAREPQVVAFARGIGLFLRPRVPAGAFTGHRQHRDAVDRAGRHAQVATRAQRLDDRVHLLRCPDDRVDRARLHAQRAADAQAFVDEGDGARMFAAVHGVQRNHGLAEQAREARDTFGAAGRALVVVRVAGGDRLGVRPAAVIAALRALRLGKQIFDAIRECFGVGHGDNGRSGAEWLSAASGAAGKVCQSSIIADFPHCAGRRLCA